MIQGCEKCTALWQEYAHATHAHVDAESKLELARLRHDQPAVERLLPEAQRAAQLRKGLRQELTAHEQSDHPRERNEAMSKESAAGQS